jgi:hypothetical protein
VKAIAVAVLALFAVPVVAGGAIPWREAGSCVGRVCPVRGIVAEVRDDGSAIRLYFDEQRRDVCVTLVRSWLVAWPDYSGRDIVARGPVRRFRGLTEVVVRDPSEIELAEAQPTPVIEYQAPAQQELEELRDEVRRLKERVQELEVR